MGNTGLLTDGLTEVWEHAWISNQASSSSTRNTNFDFEAALRCGFLPRVDPE